MQFEDGNEHAENHNHMIQQVLIEQGFAPMQTYKYKRDHTEEGTLRLYSLKKTQSKLDIWGDITSLFAPTNERKMITAHVRRQQRNSF